jgi:PAS domain S-box-containing protein
MEPIFDFLTETADGVFAVDRKQRIVLWNRSAAAMTGYGADAVLGKHCYEVIGGTDETDGPVCRRGCRTLGSVLGGELVPCREVKVRVRGGAERVLSISTILLPSKWRELSVLVHLFRDVSRRKERERARWNPSLPGTPEIKPATLSAEGPVHPETAPSLSRREVEILSLLATGSSTDTIRTSLFISANTVRNHVQNILSKLGVHSRLEAVTLGLRNGLIPTVTLSGGDSPEK